tara:strand:- start:644 stop:2203 length:1560 start_codon:yes stop_codon:yes gene_type:complete
MINKKTLILLLSLILLLGIFLRFYNIGDESFWLDETATATAVRDYNFFEIFSNGFIRGNVTPEYFEEEGNDLPLYYSLLYFWTKLFGVSELSLRILSALFGSLSILLVYFVAKELTDKKVALLSSFIFSLSMLNIVYSQEARLYSLLTFIVLSSVYFLVKLIKTEKLSYLALLTIVNIIGIYTAFIYIFFVFFQFAYALVMFKFHPKFAKKLVVSLFLMGLFYLPILQKVLSQKVGAAMYLAKPTILGIAKFWFTFNSWIYPSTELRQNIYYQNFSQFGIIDWILVTSPFLLVILMTALFTLGIFSIMSRLNKQGFIFKKFELFKLKYFVKNNWVILLLLWFFVPLLSELLLSILHPTASLFGPAKFLIFIFPAYAILISVGILSLKWKYSKVLILLFVIFSLLPLASYYVNVNKGEWGKVASFMKDNIKDDEVILLDRASTIIAFDYYYGIADNRHPAYDTEEIAQLVDNKDGVWLILSFEKYTDPNENTRTFLEEKYTLDQEKNFFDIKVLHFSKKV